MNRGSSTMSDAPSHTARQASMRPRFMNRGSRRSAAGRIASSNCFNEAPIHESGKCRARVDRSGPSARFNEAPIHESGKSVAR